VAGSSTPRRGRVRFGGASGKRKRQQPAETFRRKQVFERPRPAPGPYWGGKGRLISISEGGRSAPLLRMSSSYMLADAKLAAAPTSRQQWFQHRALTGGLRGPSTDRARGNFLRVELLPPGKASPNRRSRPTKNIRQPHACFIQVGSADDLVNEGGIMGSVGCGRPQPCFKYRARGTGPSKHFLLPLARGEGPETASRAEAKIVVRAPDELSSRIGDRAAPGRWPSNRGPPGQPRAPGAREKKWLIVRMADHPDCRAISIDWKVHRGAEEVASPSSPGSQKINQKKHLRGPILKGRA